MSEAVSHPAYYGGADNPYEAIKVIEAWELDFCLGNAVKYIARAGKKNPAKAAEDLAKARWYLTRALERLERAPRPESTCGRCEGELGRRWWSKVPGFGDLCSSCHERTSAARRANGFAEAVGEEQVR